MPKQIHLPQTARPVKKKDPLPVRIGEAFAMLIVAFIIVVLGLAIIALGLVALNGVLDTIGRELAQLI